MSFRFKNNKMYQMSFRLVPKVFYKGLTTPRLLDLKITKSINMRKKLACFYSFDILADCTDHGACRNASQNTKLQFQHFDVVFRYSGLSGIRSHNRFPCQTENERKHKGATFDLDSQKFCSNSSFTSLAML